ncbi:LPD23 domain-containing protein [Campylobacter concisus]|uniref:ADP-ribosyltransferase-containing protein n=1 Tax=Campylobacter concisus TaxID=199 RepID=UPI000CD82829|nr:LPD23 domain-containing protein [Campylobacter concisus]
MQFNQPKNYDTFTNDKKALGINAKANELKRSMTNYFSDPDDRYDNRIREANADNNAEMVDAINSIRAQFDAQVPLTQKVFGDKEVVEQKGVDALKQISAELKRQGKGSLVNADGNVLFKNKAGELVDLDQGILKDLWHSTKANKGAIVAGVGGALLAPLTGGTSLLPVIAGGAVGSALGAAGDYIYNANDTGQNVDTGTLANLALENAGLSVLGDGVGYAVAKGGKALINKAGDVINKSKTLKDSFGNEIKDVDIKQKITNAINNTPLVGDVTSSNHAPAMGDITRSIKAADAVLSPEELAEKEAYLANNKIELNDINTLGLKAKAYADDYANRTSSPWVKDKVTKAGEYVENKAKGTLDPQITKEQEIALNNAFADPSEMKTIADVIGSDDLVRNKAIKIIDDQAQKRLEAAGIDKNFRINPESFRKLDDTDKAFVSDILGSYVNATKSDYNQVVDAFKQVAGNSPLQIDKKGLDDAINSIVANYAKVEDRDKMRIALDQMAQEGFNINKAFDVRRYLNKAIRNSDYTGEQQARALKEVLDDSMFKSLGDDRGELRALLKEQDEKYAQMKALKDTKIFNKGNDLLSDDFNFDKVGDLINKNNDVWAKTTKGLNKEQIAEVEKAYIRSAIKDELVDLGMNRKGFNPIAVAEKLSDAKFVSDEAKTLQKALFDDAKFRPNTKGIIDAIDAGLKTKSQGGSIATSFSGKVAMAFVARSFERLAKHIPLIGKQAGKKNLYAEAFLKAKTTSDALTDIMKNEAIPIKDRFDLLTQAQSKEIRSLIDDFMAKKEQAKSDLIKMDTAEGNSKNTEIKGDGFIAKESPAPKSDLNVKMDLAPNVRDLSKITTEEISADLDYLASKHPEMFSKPSDVFRLIREIKNEPTHFFNNNRLDYALIVKRVGDNKIGKLAVDKESGEVKHATKVKEKDIKRLDRISRENSKDAGIIQTFIQPGSKSNSELGLPNEIIPKQTQELDKTFKNQKDKNTKTINASPHIASGFLGGTANGTANGTDENGNVIRPEEFAKGFIYALFGSKFSASAVKRISPELYNSIVGLGKKMPQMAKDNPKLLTKIYGSAKNNSINSFAGEKALNASANKLSKAKAMLEKGEDEVKIWQSTGWYKDKDGAWKFEIDDNPAKIKNQNADKLGDLLEHKELFKAYPELKDINVVKIKDELYNKNLKDWHKESSPLTKNTDGTPKIFYHGTKKSNISEFDQKFDKSKWGFFFTTDKGLSEEYSKGRYGLKEPNSGVMEVYINAKKPFDLREEITKDTANKYQALLGNLAKRDDLKNGVGKSLYEYIKNTSLKQYDTKAKAFKDKLQNAGYDSIILDDNVIVAFNPNQIKHVKNNGNFNKENDIYSLGDKGYYDPVKKEIGLREVADKSTLMHEIQHAIQDIEGFAKGSNANDKKYALYHGEAEARNVQNRLDLNKKGRAHPHETFDVNPNETFVSREDGVNFSQKLPELKEKRGIYNVTYNGKFSTPVYKDLEDVEGAVRYAIGNKNKGAKHIEIKHLEDTTKEGYVTKQELLNMGENMRKFIKEYKEPFINDRKARLYEWEDKDGVRFRLVINDIKDKNGGSGIHSAITSTSANDDIITFYSDRNLKEPMKFENPKLKLLDAIDNSSDKVGAVKKILLNKHISDGVKAKAVNRLTKNKISQGVKTNYISTKNSKNN